MIHLSNLQSRPTSFTLPPPTWPPLRRPRHALCPRPHPHPHHHPPSFSMTQSPPHSPSSTTLSDSQIHPRLFRKQFVITGATGLIGRALIAQLRLHKASISILARHPPSARAIFHHPEHAPLSIIRYNAQTSTLSSDAIAAIAAADVVINLAGEPVDAERWTKERKTLLWNSRVTGTSKVVNAMKGGTAVLISASAVGYYGTSETKLFMEDSPPGSDFLATLAAAWEKAAFGNTNNSRTVVFRIGVVLANGGGAFEKMSVAFRAFLGGVPGGGAQWFSWVHIDDVVRLLLYAAVEDKWQGVYNATAPHPVKLARFCYELGTALGRPSWLPLPKQAVRALLGNEAAELILKGQQVLPRKVKKNGFVYRYKDVATALQQLTRARADIATKK